MKKIAASAVTLLFSTLLAACGGDPSDGDKGHNGQNAESATDTVPATGDAEVQVDIIDVDNIAERFVKLALGIGKYDNAFVDAYHGPDDWAQAVEASDVSLEALDLEVAALIEALEVLTKPAGGDVRTAMLAKNLVAAQTRIKMARGETFSFDEETARLYDAVAPAYSVAEFDAALAEMEALLPGEGLLSERIDAFRQSLAIPEDKLQAVFDAAIDECRRRTIAHFDLPENERFTTGYVTDKPWSGYNWYQGDFESLIEVNTDLPVIIDRAVDLGCHEGYPGHHTWNAFVERDLLKGNGWIEYSVYPLFSPLSLIAEGSANYGIELAFPGDEKIKFERDVLYPLAGLDPAKAEMLAALNKASRKLSHSRNHIARAYLDEVITREEAIELTVKYRLVSTERAEQSMRFIDTYRGYVINYNLGRDLVRAYVEREVAQGVDPWAAFESILTTPTAASDIASAQ